MSIYTVALNKYLSLISHLKKLMEWIISRIVNISKSNCIVINKRECQFDVNKTKFTVTIMTNE